MAPLIEPGPVRLMVARFPWQRAIGLIGRAGLPPDEGLLLPRCRAVHTVGMRFPIDVVFIDRDGIVIRVAYAVHPFRIVVCPGAASVIELSCGVAERLSLVVGLCLEIPIPAIGAACLRRTRLSAEPGARTGGFHVTRRHP